MENKGTMSDAHEMSFRMRASKFRHVYGSAYKKDQCYEGLQISKNAHEANFCAVNPNYIAVITEVAGGGSFIVIPIENTGRVDANAPKVCGHKSPVLDIKWNPFNDDVIASASDDATVKLWQIPEGGLQENLSDWLVDLHGHTRRVGQLEWHPTAENILLSSSYDHSCILWNVETAEPMNVMSDQHPDTIYSLAWNRDGSLFSTTCKDKRLRVLDPRLSNVAMDVASHQGTKASKAAFVNKNRLFTIGFSRMCDRQYSIWDLKNMSKPLKTEEIDSSSGVMFPFYDPDTSVMFLAGKGDGNIRYFEIVDDKPHIHFLNQYQSGSPQRGLGCMPKRGLDTSRCEIFRFYKLHTIKPLCEPISMIVPRKSEIFQEDIYPATASGIPSLSAEEWLAGNNRQPILMSLKDGQVLTTPSSTTTHALKKQNVAESYVTPATVSLSHAPDVMPRPITIVPRKHAVLKAHASGETAFHTASVANPTAISVCANMSKRNTTKNPTLSKNDPKKQNDAKLSSAKKNSLRDEQENMHVRKALPRSAVLVRKRVNSQEKSTKTIKPPASFVRGKAISDPSMSKEAYQEKKKPLFKLPTKTPEQIPNKMTKKKTHTPRLTRSMSAPTTNTSFASRSQSSSDKDKNIREQHNMRPKSQKTFQRGTVLQLKRQFSDSRLHKKEGSSVSSTPTITTYKAVRREQHDQSPRSNTAPAVSKARSADQQQAAQPQTQLPASVHNIAKLSGRGTQAAPHHVQHAPPAPHHVQHAPPAPHEHALKQAGTLLWRLARHHMHSEETVDVSDRIGMFESKQTTPRWQKSYNSPIKTEVTELPSPDPPAQAAPRRAPPPAQAEPTVSSAARGASITATPGSCTNATLHLNGTLQNSSYDSKIDKKSTVQLHTNTSTQNTVSTESASSLRVVTRGIAQPLKKKDRAVAAQITTSSTVTPNAGAPTHGSSSARAVDKSPTRAKQHNKDSTKLVNGRQLRSKVQCPDSTESDEEINPKPASSVRKPQGHKKKSANLAYRKRRENLIMNESSDVSEVFTSPPLSPKNPFSAKNNKLSKWSENPLYSQEITENTEATTSASVDISALDDALHDFEEISSKMTDQVPTRQTQSPSSSRSTPDIRKKIDSQRNKTVVVYPMSSSLTNIGQQPPQALSASSEDASNASERAISVKDIRSNFTSSTDYSSSRKSSSPSMERQFSAFSPSATLSSSKPKMSHNVSSKSVESVLKDTKVSIPDSNLSQQYACETNEHDTSLDGLITSLRFVSSPDKLESPQSRLSVSEQSTEMLDYLNAPDDTLIKPSKMRASLRSKRRHTTEINFKPGSVTSSEHSEKSCSPSPAKDIEVSALESALNMKTAGPRRSWQTSSFREKKSDALPEHSESPFQRSNSLRDRSRKGLDTSILGKATISENTAEVENAQKSGISGEMNNNSRHSKKTTVSTSPTLYLENARISPNRPITLNMANESVTAEAHRATKQSPINRVSVKSQSLTSASSPMFSPSALADYSVEQTQDSGVQLTRSTDDMRGAQLLLDHTHSGQDSQLHTNTSPRTLVHLRTSQPRNTGRPPQPRKIHVKKVWSPRMASPSDPALVYHNGEAPAASTPNTDAELRKAYFRQLEEINSLKEQINYKDKRIRQLEDEIRLLRCGPANIDESTC